MKFFFKKKSFKKSPYFLTFILGWMTLTMTLTPAGILNPKTATLPNGLKIVVIENDMAPVASVAVAYRVGTADDPPHIVGVSHFLEHMMFKGTKKTPGDQFIKTILLHGGNTNAFTSFDYTVYTTDMAVDYLDVLFGLEADRMVNLAFDKKEVDSEKKVVMEERLMRLENNPMGQAFEVILKNAFWYHSYGVHPIGYPHHIEAYTYENTFDHYNKWYTPNNAVLIVSGRVTLEHIKALAEKHFGSIQSKETPKRFRPTEPYHNGITTHIRQEGGRIRSHTLLHDYAAPNHTQTGGRVDPKHFYALILLAHYMGGNENSLLYQRLVEEKAMALDADVDFGDASLDPSPFGISVTLSPQTSFDAVSTEIQSLITQVQETPMSLEAIQRCVKEIESSYAFSRDGNSGIVYILLPMLCGISLEDIDQWPEKFKHLTPKDIQEAARALFGDPALLEARLSPKQEDPS
jgi:zinc protease